MIMPKLTFPRIYLVYFCSSKQAHFFKFSFWKKHLCQSLFFDKVAGLRPAILLKKRLRYRCFSVNFVKFPRTPFLQNNSGRLLLKLPMFPGFHLSYRRANSKGRKIDKVSFCWHVNEYDDIDEYDDILWTRTNPVALELPRKLNTDKDLLNRKQ